MTRRQLLVTVALTACGARVVFAQKSDGTTAEQTATLSIEGMT